MCRIGCRAVERLVAVHVGVRAVAHGRWGRVHVLSVLSVRVVVVVAVVVVLILPVPLHVQGPLHVVAVVFGTKVRPVFLLSSCISAVHVFLAVVAVRLGVRARG
jgi:hypothetical protein